MRKIIIIAIVLIIGGLFWYYEIKPTIVRNKCNQEQGSGRRDNSLELFPIPRRS